MGRGLLSLIAMLLFQPGAVALAQPAEPFAREVVVPREAVAAAARALPRFREIVRRQGNFRAMGFETPEELDRAELGEPLPMAMVRLDELGRFAPGQAPETLVHPVQRVLFPVRVGAEVRSSVALARTTAGWQATSYGGPNLARTLSRARADSAAATGVPPSAYFALEVSGLNVFFVAHRSPQGLSLTPVRDESAFGFRAGASLPAAEAFRKMQPAARSRPDLPG